MRVVVVRRRRGGLYRVMSVAVMTGVAMVAGFVWRFVHGGARLKEEMEGE